ncbi:MAG: hypothetical protein J7M25_17080 [Deltaproteobacteria bacterium]|nr:hypothetical protein [Deltaproteobacteria bacterium]
MIPVEEIVEDWETKSKFYLSMLPVIWEAAASAWLRRADQLSAEALSTYRQACSTVMQTWMPPNRQPSRSGSDEPVQREATRGRTPRTGGARRP